MKSQKKQPIKIGMTPHYDATIRHHNPLMDYHHDIFGHFTLDIWFVLRHPERVVL